MEVHAHTHTERKKLTHYLWEFLMLFFAVFCGFLAENFREHQVEHKREYQFMRSMVADLQNDTIRLNDLLSFSNRQLRNYDSLRNLFKNQGNTDHNRKLYYHFLPTTYYDLFSATRRTINQMESSGGMRLIRKLPVSDSITDYYNQVKATIGQGDGWLRYFDEYHATAFTVFDYSQIDTVFYNRQSILASSHAYSLLTSDERVLKILYNKLFALRFILQSYVSFLEELKNKAISTLEFIKKEYHLE